MNKIITTICFAMVSTPITAQSSLCIQSIDLRGMIQDEVGTAQSDLSARLVVAITQYHGFQGDVSFADTD